MATQELDDKACGLAWEMDLARGLEELQQEISALRGELSAAGRQTCAAADNYQQATKIDILVNKFLRLVAKD